MQCYKFALLKSTSNVYSTNTFVLFQFMRIICNLANETKSGPLLNMTFCRKLDRCEIYEMCANNDLIFVFVFFFLFSAFRSIFRHVCILLYTVFVCVLKCTLNMQNMSMQLQFSFKFYLYRDNRECLSGKSKFMRNKYKKLKLNRSIVQIQMIGKVGQFAADIMTLVTLQRMKAHSTLINRIKSI